VARRELAKTDGKPGVAQREYKESLQRSVNAPASGAVLPAMRGAGAAGGTAASKKLADRYAASAGRAVLAQDAEGEVQVLDTIRNVGQKTFFHKEQRWQDSTVTADQAKNAIRVVQFSKEYFDLAAAHGGTLAKYIAFDEPVLVNLGPKTYQIDPPAADDSEKTESK
jgi:hypothetical protein